MPACESSYKRVCLLACTVSQAYLFEDGYPFKGVQSLNGTEKNNRNATLIGQVLIKHVETFGFTAGTWLLRLESLIAF